MGRFSRRSGNPNIVVDGELVGVDVEGGRGAEVARDVPTLGLGVTVPAAIDGLSQEDDEDTPGAVATISSWALLRGRAKTGTPLFGGGPAVCGGRARYS